MYSLGCAAHRDRVASGLCVCACTLMCACVCMCVGVYTFPRLLLLGIIFVHPPYSLRQSPSLKPTNLTGQLALRTPHLLLLRPDLQVTTRPSPD